jgi:hypothetical protein
VSFPFDLHSAAVFDSHMPCRSPAMPRICLSEIDFSRPRQGDGMRTAWERHGVCELALAVLKRHVGNLPAFGVFVLPRVVPGSVLSEAYQSQVQVASVKQSNVCHGRGEAYYFGARTSSDSALSSVQVCVLVGKIQTANPTV